MNLIADSFVSYVNLDHRKDRLLRMKRSLKIAGLSAVRTRGLLPREYSGDPKLVAKMHARTPGAIGCYFSQISIMLEALKQGKHAFVMEDDLIFCNDFSGRIAIIEQFLSNNPWDVVWLGGTFHVNPPWWHKQTLKRDAELTDHPHMVRTYGAFCTYAYIVNAASLVKVLDLLEKELENTIGIDYSFIQIQPQLHTYAFVPGCATQYDNQSDIGNGITRFSGFAKLGPYWFQSQMENFNPSKFNWHEADPKNRSLWGSGKVVN